MDLLRTAFGDEVNKALNELCGLGCGPDDLLDAFIALWTARRIRDGVAQSIPLVPEYDAYGLAMQIVA